MTDLQQQQRALEAQLDDARKHLDEAKAQATETAKKCENSEKMIVWLNKQLTSIQLGGGGVPTNGGGNANGTGPVNKGGGSANGGDGSSQSDTKPRTRDAAPVAIGTGGLLQGLDCNLIDCGCGKGCIQESTPIPRRPTELAGGNGTDQVKPSNTTTDTLIS